MQTIEDIKFKIQFDGKILHSTRDWEGFLRLFVCSTMNGTLILRYHRGTIAGYFYPEGSSRMDDPIVTTVTGEFLHDFLTSTNDWEEIIDWTDIIIHTETYAQF